MSVWELTNVAVGLVLPPGILMLLALIGLSVMRAAPRLGRGITLVSVLTLLALSLPIVGSNLLRAIEAPYSDSAGDRRGGAIVVLGGGSYLQAPEYGQDTVSWATLERVRYAAHLHKRTKKPLLVTS